MGEVVWTQRARNDLKEIYDYIAASSPLVALSVAVRLSSAVIRLSDFPQSGRFVPERRTVGVRELFVRPYRIAYRISGDSIRILKIHHGAQMLSATDFKEQDD